MNAKDIIKNPALIHEVEDHEVELRVREVVERLAKKGQRPNDRTWSGLSKDKKGRKSGKRLMLFIGALYQRDPALSNAAVCAYAKLGGNVNALIQQAVLLKKDPRVAPFLDYLRTAIGLGNTGERYRRGRIVVYNAEQRGCTWAGLDAKQTEREVRNIVPRR